MPTRQATGEKTEGTPTVVTPQPDPPEEAEGQQPSHAEEEASGQAQGESVESALERIGDWEVHPAAAVFPRNPPQQQGELEESLRTSGLLHAIALLEGRVLDGRNRLRGCLKAGVEPRFEEVDPEVDPVDYVIRANLHRRHLDRSQRAVAAARLAALPVGRPSAERRQACRFSAKQAAALFGISPRLVRGARAVRRRGIPDLVEAIERGEMTVGRAEVLAKAPAKAQRELLERIRRAPNKAEQGLVLQSIDAATGGGSEGFEELARARERDRCVRKLATLVRDAADPEFELDAVSRELTDLVGVSRESTTDSLPMSRGEENRP